MSFQFDPSSSEMICAMVEAMCWPMSALPHVTVTMPVRRNRVPDAGIEVAGCGERLVGAEQAGNCGIAERETCGGGADEERAAAEIGGLALSGDFHVRIHVALRSVAVDAVRISEAARMMAFWMRE